MTTYERAPEVQAIAEKLLDEVPDHKPLVDARIEYVWRDKATKSKGRICLAKARRLSGLNAFLYNAAMGLADSVANEPLFVIEVAADTWARLRPEQRIALVDHELCHCTAEFDDDGELVLGMRGHDLEEFAAVVHRHGLWKSDVATFGAEVAEQLALAVEEAASFLEGPEPDGDLDAT